MNTANLQLEGLYSAVAALINALRDKDILSVDEIDKCLAEAERVTAADRPRDLSPANLEAIRFPLRYLRAANRAAARGTPRSFAALAAEVGMTKDL